MTLPVYRSPEPLYIVVVRSSDAESRLREWCREHGVQAQIDGNRMRLYEMNHLVSFQITWTGVWNQVQIWDCWNRRHLNTD